MRHVLQANSVSTVTFGVGEATIPALLVASASLKLGELTGNAATAAPAVNLPMITTAADDNPHIASNAEKGSTRIVACRDAPGKPFGPVTPRLALEA